MTQYRRTASYQLGIKICIVSDPALPPFRIHMNFKDEQNPKARPGDKAEPLGKVADARTSCEEVATAGVELGPIVWTEWAHRARASQVSTAQTPAHPAQPCMNSIA